MNIKIYFISAILLGSLLVGCFPEVKNHIYSNEMKDSGSRVEELEKYFILRSETLDAEYDIFDVNIGASRSIPGPTSRDYKVALLLTPENSELWLADVEKSQGKIDYSWAMDLVHHNTSFKISSEPEYYISENKEVIIFRKEGIVFVRIKQD